LRRQKAREREIFPLWLSGTPIWSGVMERTEGVRLCDAWARGDQRALIVESEGLARLKNEAAN
jgi:hypothetical protein